MDAFFENLEVSKEEFLFQYQSHPDFPSNLAFSDTLNFMGIKNDVYELEKEHWDELPDRFITLYKNNYAVIERNSNGLKIYGEKIQNITTKQLLEESGELVFLFEKTENATDKNSINGNWFLFSLFVLILLFSIFQFTLYQALYNLLSMFGIYISLEVFNRKFGKKSFVINNICNSTSVASSQNGCAKIIDSDKINVWGLKISDFSLIYFTGISILGLFFPYTQFVLKFLALFSILVIFYSLSIQIFVEKVFCKICLIIISLLIGQITLASIFLTFNFDVNGLILSAFAFFATFFCIIYINNLLKQNEKYKVSSFKNLKFKKNYKIFIKELKEKPINFKYRTPIFTLGNKNSKINLSLISNPYCGYCKNAHAVLEKLINRYPDISAQIRFNYFSDTSDDNLNLLISSFKNIYDLEGEKYFLEAIEFWYIDRDIESFKKKFKSFLNRSNLSDIIALGEENKNHAISFTPAFVINNYQFPQNYEIDDIFYFIDELIEDATI